MASLNKVLLMGNLTRDPELTYTPGGAAICKFGIAINRRFSQNGQDKEETCFLDIVVWGKQAETASRYLQKGAGVFIEGRLTYEQWEEKDTQKKRSRITVTAERVQFLNGRRDDMGGGDAGGAGDYDSSYEQQLAYTSRNSSSQGNRAYGPRQQQNRPSGQGGGGSAYGGNHGASRYQQQAGSQQGGGGQPPQMPPPQEEYPFEDVGGVDDDIPF